VDWDDSDCNSDPVTRSDRDAKFGKDDNCESDTDFGEEACCDWVSATDCDCTLDGANVAAEAQGIAEHALYKGMESMRNVPALAT